MDFFGLEDLNDIWGNKEWLEDPKNRLLAELYAAERDARKNGKGKTKDCHGFEANLWENLINLRDALWEMVYKPSRGAVHVVKKPVKREIFAAPFVDRIIHHWIIAQIGPWWEKRLHHGSCSCRVGKGTSFGVRFLDKNIRQVSHNFAKGCTVVKLDITGYFMHINRRTLFRRVRWGLKKQFEGQLDTKRYKMLLYAIREIIFDDPTVGVSLQGNYEDWRDLPLDKSLFAAAPGCGLVIGNLTSQVFSNIYLDALDRYITQTLGYKHYVRYVDDLCIVIPPDEKDKLMADVELIETFLNGMGLFLNRKKTKSLASWQGVPFLGYVVKNGVIMPGKRIVRNFYEAVYKVQVGVKDSDTITSYLGMMIHYDAGKVCHKVFESVGWEYQQ